MSETSFSEWTDEQAAEQWLVDLGGMRLGPLGREEIVEMLNAGSIRHEDQIRRVDSETWSPASSLLAAAVVEAPQVEVVSVTIHDPLADVAVESHAPRKFPQYFACIDGRVRGPVPLDALQQLADTGGLKRDTPVRVETSKNWATGAKYGIEFPAVAPLLIKKAPTKSIAVQTTAEIKVPELSCKPVPKPAASQPAKAASRTRTAGGVAWLLFAPVHYAATLVQAAMSVRRAYLLIAAAAGVLLINGAIALNWSWKTTAASGILVMNDRPLPSVLVTVTNMKTGETAIGFSNSSGNMKYKCLTGQLSHGSYRITLQRPAEYESTDLPAVPAKYQNIATSDLDIDYQGGAIDVVFYAAKSSDQSRTPRSR